MYVIGCDPGKTGAIVGVGLDRLVILRTPHMKSPKGKGEEIMYGSAWEMFKKLLTEHEHPQHAFIERVQAMPQQGGSSMFKFGYSAGFLRGMIVAAGIPLDMVEPQAWKKTARIKHGADKEASVIRACELFPRDTEALTPKRGSWTKEECIGVADAALIGYHGLALLTGGGAKVLVQEAADECEFDI